MVKKIGFVEGYTVAYNVKDNLSLKIEVIQLKARYANENLFK